MRSNPSRSDASTASNGMLTSRSTSWRAGQRGGRPSRELLAPAERASSARCTPRSSPRHCPAVDELRRVRCASACCCPTRAEACREELHERRVGTESTQDEARGRAPRWARRRATSRLKITARVAQVHVGRIGEHRPRGVPRQREEPVALDEVRNSGEPSLLLAAWSWRTHGVGHVHVTPAAQRGRATTDRCPRSTGSTARRRCRRRRGSAPTAATAPPHHANTSIRSPYWPRRASRKPRSPPKPPPNEARSRRC